VGRARLLQNQVKETSPARRWFLSGALPESNGPCLSKRQPYQLPVMLENHLLICVTHFQREFGGIF
jgi:hypothetical protein